MDISVSTGYQVKRMSTFIKIKALRPTLSQSEAKLADFTLSSGTQIRTLSSIELAKAAGVSQSSVVKFAQKLGYRGFPAFKLAVVDALNEQTSEQTSRSTQFEQSDSLADISEKLIANQHKTLSATQKLNNGSEFERTVQALKAARKVLICAKGASWSVAQDFAFKLQKVGISAVCHSDEFNAASYVASMGKEDLLVVISNSGQTKALLKLAEQAKRNECRVFAITRYGDSQLSEMAEHVLFTVQEAEPINHSAILTRASQCYLIDTLFVALAQSNLHWQRRVERANDNMRAIFND